MKKNAKIRFALAAALCAVCLSLCSCSDNEKPTASNPGVTENGGVENNAVSGNEAENNTENNGGEDTGGTENGGTELPDEPVYLNKLTGLPTTEELSNIRPLALMINNLKIATPQQGISLADIIYEVPAEGGITRLLCLFTDYASLPETGSVRSSRDYYIDLSDAHDAIYVHCGTSPQATEVLNARKTDHMDGIYFSTPFYRNGERWNKMGKEHSMMTTGELLAKGIEEKGFRTESDAEQPLKFAESRTDIENGSSAEYAKIKFSYYAASELEYDAENGVYLKSQYSAPHIDGNTGEQLAFENAVFLYCTQYVIPGDDAGRLAVEFTGSGTGYYITGGKYESIKWSKPSRTSPYTLYEEDGETELILNPGKTYIAIASTGAETVFE